MKILIVNWVYNWGSTGYIVRDLKKELTLMGHKVLVAAGRSYGEDDVMVFSDPFEYKIFWKMHRLGLSTFRGSTSASKKLIRYIEQNKPDIVNLHLLHCNFLNLYYLLEWLGKNNIKTVITNHAELYYTGSCGYAYDCMNFVKTQCRICPNKRYATGGTILGGNTHRQWKLMNNAFCHFKKENLLFTAVSPWTQERFYLSPIANRFTCNVTLNGVDTTIFNREKDVSPIFDRLGDNQPYVLWVTANFNPSDKNDVKGSYYLIELARHMPYLRFLIVATNYSNSEQLPKNIILWGKAKSQHELAMLYSGADISVLVSRRETFSMVTAESLCCGTPVVGFRAGGPESIAIKEYSHFVNNPDIEALSKAINEMMDKSFDRNAISDKARKLYSQKTMAYSYLESYRQLLKL